MVISTQHLLMVKEAKAPPSVTPAIVDTPIPPSNADETLSDVPSKEANVTTPAEAADAVSGEGEPADGDVEMEDGENATKQDQKPPASAEQSASDVPASSQPASGLPSEVIHPSYDPTFSYPGGYPLDLEFEASRLPLDVAVFNSTRACGGGDEKIRKYLQAVLVVGGTSLMPGMAHALESR
jgi:actin-related protein 8